MIWHLIAAIFSGLAAAGIALLLRKISRNKLPKWIIPLAVGIGMLSYQISTEYNWYDLKVVQLSESSNFEVVTTQDKANLWRPWTYFMPMVGAFTIIDIDSIQLGQINEQKMAQFMLYRFERQHIDRVKNQVHLLNCASLELIPLQDDGQPIVDQLKTIKPTDPLYLTVCNQSN